MLVVSLCCGDPCEAQLGCIGRGRADHPLWLHPSKPLLVGSGRQRHLSSLVRRQTWQPLVTDITTESRALQKVSESRAAQSGFTQLEVARRSNQSLGKRGGQGAGSTGPGCPECPCAQCPRWPTVYVADASHNNPLPSTASVSRSRALPASRRESCLKQQDVR